MAKYGTSIYGTFLYGQKARLSFSVEPITLLALSFSAMRVTWEAPQGTFSKIRLVRNQDGYAETAEDGIIVWEEASATPSITTIDDGIDNPTVTPLVPGRMVYYRMFLFNDESIWVSAGDANTIVPFDNQTHEKLVSFLPRVFTSVEKTPLGQEDQDSDLWDFLGGLSLSLEELLAYLNLLRPRSINTDTPISLLPLEYNHLGLTPELALPIKNQKRLIREALYLYARKGTISGLETYIESLTGYAPRISVSENLLLNVQDSTFYNSTGNWVGVNATLTASDAITPATGTFVEDEVYSCSVVATGVSYMVLGANDPIKRAVPLSPNTIYTLSCKLRSPLSAGTVTLKTTFYNRHGVAVGTTASSEAISADNTWKTASVTVTTPADATYADVQVHFSAAGTYYIDQVCYQAGERVEYDEARMITVVLDTPYENLVRNPTFETNTNFWTSTGSPLISLDADVTDQAYAGNKSAKIVASGAWTFTADDISVDIGQYYTASLYAKTTSAVTLTLTAKSDLGTTVATQTRSINNAGWTRHDLTILIPASSDATTVSLSLSGTSGTYFVDCVQFERSFKASEYFDGSLPEEYGVVWGETAYNSVSYRYPSRDQKIPRLEGTIDDWIPNNSWWRVLTERNQESYEAEMLLKDAAYYISARDASASGQTITNLGSAGALLPTTVGSTSSADSNDPLFLSHTGINYIYTPGTSGNIAITVADATSLDITGDIDVRAYVALDDWTPATTNELFSKWGTTPDRSWIFRVTTAGNLEFLWSNDGTTILTKTSTVAPTIADGSPLWVRATLDVDNGASGNDVKFYTSTDGVTYTQLGSTVTTAGVTSIYNSVTQVRDQGGGNFRSGKLFRLQLFAGLDETDKRLDVDTSVITAGSATSFTALTGQTVTISRGTSGRKTVAVCSPSWLFGTDDFLQVSNRYITYSGTNYLYLPGVASNFASAPDSAALDITGDIDLRVKVALDDWTPGVVNTLIAKATSATTNRSYRLNVNTDGTLELATTPDGTTANQVIYASTVAPTVADGATLWVRATLDVDNGASGKTATFFTSDNGTTWTQLGTAVTTAGTTSIFSGTSPLYVGGLGTAQPSRGKFFRAQVLDGIDGTVAFDANFETSITSLLQASFTESSANAATVTINRSGDGFESAGITQTGYLYPGATNTFSASATEFLNFASNQSFSVVAIVRQWGTATTGPYINNISQTSASGRGWYLNPVDMRIGDGTTRHIRTYTGPTAGTVASLIGIRNAEDNTLYVSSNGTLSASTTDTTTGDLNWLLGATRIGSTVFPTVVYQDFEGYAFAVFRRVLTADEARLLGSYFRERFK